MNKNGLTISMIFQGQSANYGEGVGNIAQLKKMTRSNGKVYTYISRQALRYNIVQQMGIDNTPVCNSSDGDNKKKKSVQFSPDTTIETYPEIDLFGYMKTKSGNNALIRSAVVRLSNAISLEPYNADMDFLNNMGLAKRNNLDNALAQSEIHNSLYAYTITVDLDRVGIDGDINISNDEKAKRVINLLDTIQFLYRDIRGRRENFNPVFAIGGLYERKNPYFEDRLKLNKGNLNIDIINSIIDSCDDTKNNTLIGYVSGYFNNDDTIKDISNIKSVSDMFNNIKKEVEQYYA